MALRRICVELGYTTVDHIDPNEELNYPFVFVGEQFEQPEFGNKDIVDARTQITLHFWHNDHRQRGTLTQMMNEVEERCVRLNSTNNLYLVFLNKDTQMLSETPLMHGILEVEYKYY